MFILSSLLFVCPFVLCPCHCMQTHTLALTKSLTHTLLPHLTASLTPSLSHSPIHLLPHLQTHLPTAQPLRVVTEDTCLFHYLVPAPMSPSNKSVGSDAGSQDSGDGNAGPRCVFVCVRGYIVCFRAILCVVQLYMHAMFVLHW